MLVIGGIMDSLSKTPLAAQELILETPPLQAFTKGEASKIWWHIRDVMGFGSGLDQVLGQLSTP